MYAEMFNESISFTNCVSVMDKLCHKQLDAPPPRAGSNLSKHTEKEDAFQVRSTAIVPV